MDQASMTALAENFRVLGNRLFRTSDVNAALHDLVQLATVSISFCEWAGVTQVAGSNKSGFTTIAATDPVVRIADEIQYELSEGPCLDAASVDGVFLAGDLQSSDDWPVFGRQVTAATPIRSLLSLPIYPDPVRAALNLYSAKTHAFTPGAVDMATLFAAHAQVLLSLTRQTSKVANLDRALVNSRLIGNAVGILMYAHRITDEEAFDRLRRASANLNRKLADVATEVTETGQLPARHRAPGPPPGGHH